MNGNWAASGTPRPVGISGSSALPAPPAAMFDTSPPDRSISVANRRNSSLSTTRPVGRVIPSSQVSMTSARPRERISRRRFRSDSRSDF